MAAMVYVLTVNGMVINNGPKTAEMCGMPAVTEAGMSVYSMSSKLQCW